MPLKFETELDDSKFVKSLKNMASEASAFNSKLETGLKSGASNFGLLAGGVAVAGAALIAGVKGLIDFGSNLRDSIDATDLSSDSFQRMSFAFSQSGADQAQFTRGMQTLSVKMQEARDGNEKTIQSFARLGITVDDLSSTDEVLGMIADGTKNAKNSSVALASSLDLLGKSGKAMQAGLKDGADGIKGIGSAIDALTDEQLNKLDAMGDKIELTKNRIIAATASNALYYFGGGEREDMDARKKLAKPSGALEIAGARNKLVDDKMAQADQEQKENKARWVAEAASQAKFIASEKDKEEERKYKARAEEFKKLDADKIKYAADKEKLEADELYEHRKMQYDELEKNKEAGRERDRKNNEILIEEARKKSLAAKEGERDQMKEKLSGAQSNLSNAQGKLTRDIGDSVRRGLETPQQRHADELKARRDAREERRLNANADDALNGNSGTRRGSRSGDARRAREIAIDRRNVKDASKDVKIAQASIKELTDAIEKLIVKP